MSHIYINGIKIRQNTGITRDNTINYLESKLTTGKSNFKILGDTSEEITFKSILRIKQLDEKISIGRTEKISKPIAQNNSLHEAYKLLAERSKKEPLTITIVENEELIDNNKSLANQEIVKSHGQTFQGRIKELTWDYSVEGYREYSWTIVEDANFKPSEKEFETFNYKKPTVKTNNSKNKSNTPTYIKHLFNCNIKKDCCDRKRDKCDKKKIKCIKYLQKLMQTDGYYTKYKVDGWWCTYTQQEFLKWQKRKAKVKVTGKWDDNCKFYIDQRFKLGNFKGHEFIIDKSRMFKL